MAGIADSVAALRLTVVLLVPMFTACSVVPTYSPDLATLSPLQRDVGELSVVEAELMAPTPDLLALTPEMREFADRYVLTARSQRQRLHMLNSSLRSDAMQGMEYDPDADGTAAEAFHRGTANCLSYAHLFVSLARYAGLDARYQSLELRPNWSRYGDRVALRQHVNVVVNLSRREQYMVDISPVRRNRVSGNNVLRDEEAFALHHNNLAMAHLRSDRVVEAYAHAVKAVGMSAATDFLWINLGAIYSRAGQLDNAEQSYLTALKLNPNSRSAMNNLTVLFNRRGDAEGAAFWERQVAGYRNRNPYYFMYLGQLAEQEGDFQAAVGHYKTAISRKGTDAEFYFRLGKLYFELQQRGRGIRYVEMAIEHSQLVDERAQYKAFLERITDQSLAQLH